MLTLITDRKQSDIDRAKQLIAKAKNIESLSLSELEEYLGGLKGCYNISDLNRVENAVKYLSDLLNLHGYPNTVTTKTDWDANDILKVSEIQRYLDNIAELRNKYYSNIENELPTTSTWLTIEGANEIERILVDIDQILRNMQNVFVHSGVANAGQNRIWQQRFRRVIERLKYKVFGNSEQATRSGKNLLQQSNFTNSTTVSGITFTPNSDGSIKITGTSTAKLSLNLTNLLTNNLTSGVNYICSLGIAKTSNPRLVIEEKKGDTWIRVVASTSGTATFTYNGFTTGDNFSTSIVIDSGITLDTTVYPQVEKGSTATKYEPYGISPSPDYPSQVYGLGSRTRNLFDHSLIKNENITTKLETGFNMAKKNDERMGTVWNMNLPAGTYKFVGDVKTNVATEADFSFWVKYEGGTERYVRYTALFNDAGYNFTNKVISIQPYFQSTTANGSYFEVTNFMLLDVKEQDTSFVPHKAIEIKQKIGDNLYDVSKSTKGKYIDASGQILGLSASQISELIKIENNEVYNISGFLNDTANIVRIHEYDKNGNWLRQLKTIAVSEYSEMENTFQTNADSAYIRISHYIAWQNFQVTKGRERKPYVPFIEYTKCIDLTNHEPLMKIGDIEDYIDYENSRIVRKIGKVVYDGSSDETWAYVSGSGGYMYSIKAELVYPQRVNGVAACTHFIQDNSKAQYGYFRLGNNYAFMIWNGFTIVSDWKTWLASNPITIWYELEEPYYEEINLPDVQKLSGEYTLTACDEYLEGRIEKE